MSKLQLYITISGDKYAITNIRKLFDSSINHLKTSNFNNSYQDYLSGGLVSGKTFIYLACRESKLEIVKHLIEEQLLDFKVKSTVSILYIILYFNQIEEVEDIKCEFESNLEVASRWGHIHILNYLLSLPSLKQIREHGNKHPSDSKNNNYLGGKSTLVVPSYPTYSKEEIMVCLNKSYNKEIMLILKAYLKHYHKSKSRCYCI